MASCDVGRLECKKGGQIEWEIRATEKKTVQKNSVKEKET